MIETIDMRTVDSDQSIAVFHTGYFRIYENQRWSQAEDTRRCYSKAFRPGQRRLSTSGKICRCRTSDRDRRDLWDVHE